MADGLEMTPGAIPNVHRRNCCKGSLEISNYRARGLPSVQCVWLADHRTQIIVGYYPLRSKVVDLLTNCRHGGEPTVPEPRIQIEMCLACPSNVQAMREQELTEKVEYSIVTTA